MKRVLAPILDIKNLSVFSNESPLLQNISFSLKKYSILGIIGESGSGKSLTALSILNILKYKGLKQIGDIIYDGDNIISYDSNQFRDFLKKEIGIIFQDPSSYLNPSMKCGVQMLEVLNQKSSEEFLSEILKKVKFSNPKEILNRYPHELSGGQKQRIMIAMMIAKNSKIIICDEATSSLDALIKKEIIELLLDLKKEFELSMIFISHNLKLIHKICDEVVFLKNGKLVEKGKTNDVFKSPKSNYTKNLIELNFKPIVKKSKNEPSAKNLLTIKKLNLEINNFKILSEINFNLKRNEVLGIIGESGSGKTSIARCILNIYRNYTGNIYFNTDNIKDSNRTDLSKKIQVIFQDPYASLDPSVKVINQIIEVLKFHKIAANIDLKERATSILESVNLNSKLHNKLPSELSGGERQRVVIARAISISPKVLICDECVSALDKNIQKLILELLLKIKEEMSLSLIFISHDISLIQSIADRIVVLKNGVILDYRQTDKVINNPKKYTKQLISASF